VYGYVNQPLNGASTIFGLTGFGGFQPGFPDIGAYPIEYHSSNGLNVIMTFEGLRKYAYYVLDHAGSSFTTFRKDADGRNNHADVVGLTVTSNRISYSVSVRHRNLPNHINGLNFSYTVNIFLDDDGVVTAACDGIQRYEGVGLASGLNKLQPRYKQHLNVVLDLPHNYLRHVILHSKHSIAKAAPGLSHTQSKAIGKMLTEVSRNLESLVESPGIPALLTGLLSWPAEAIENFIVARSLVTKCYVVIEALCRGILTWKFALEPTMKSAKDAILSARKMQRKYEASLSYSSREEEFDGLPESLKRFILLEGMVDNDVAEYKITLHTETSMRITLEFLARYFASLLGLARKHGIAPEPKILWQLQPWSFVFDWFIPMSQYIDDAQQYFNSYYTPISTLGHSVFVEVVTSDGWIYSIFIRSDNSTDPLDLVPEAWNKSSDIPPIAIPLFVITLMGIGKRLFS
jgi:hypothetical protein